MFDPIIERVFSYKRVIFESSNKHFKRLLNILKNINNYISVFSIKIKYQIDLRRKYYYLGKYLSNSTDNKHDFSRDKLFIDYMNEIKIKKQLLNQNKKDLSSLYKKDKKYN
tara:strand:+ start:1720 stop:2052 length:333 start_codon:yes stop_codon:yes gene_type:complete